MAKPTRPGDPNSATGVARAYFVTTSTAQGKSIFQTERMAKLFVDVLRSYVKSKAFVVHDFVVMPNHVHLLLTVPGETTLEKAVQLVKGNFSFRAKKELGYGGEVWQRGFSDARIVDDTSFSLHRDYIRNNPVKAGLAMTPEDYPHGYAALHAKKSAGAKARNSVGTSVGATEVVP